MFNGKISINAHSSIRVEAEKVIYFDPFKLTVEAHDADVIFLTHEHYDHCSPEDIAKCANDSTTFVCPAVAARVLAKAGIPAERTVVLAPGDKAEVCGLPVEAVAAYNILKPFHPKLNGDTGFVVTIGGARVYVAGDTDKNRDNVGVKCDIALVPAGGTYTMDAKAAAEFVNILKPEVAIPTHYGSIVGKADDGEKFAKLVDSSIRVELLIK